MRPNGARRTTAANVFFRTLAILAVSLLALAGQTPAAAAPRQDFTYEQRYLQADPEQVTICTRDKITIGVRAVRRVQRFDTVFHILGLSFGGNPRSDTRDTVGGVDIGGISQDSSIGDISPFAAQTTNMTASPIGWSQFTFRARAQPGRTQVIFRDVSGGYEPVTVEVEVKRCKYLIETDGDWEFGWGWVPQANENMKVEVTPNEAGEFDVLAPVLNGAVFTHASQCSADIQATESKARVKGGVFGGRISFRVTYDPVPGAAFVTCPNVPGSGENQKGGVPAVIQTQSLYVYLGTSIQRAATTTVPQEVQANGTWTGQTKVTVTTIPE